MTGTASNTLSGRDGFPAVVPLIAGSAILILNSGADLIYTESLAVVTVGPFLRQLLVGGGLSLGIVWVLAPGSIRGPLALLSGGVGLATAILMWFFTDTQPTGASYVLIVGMLLIVVAGVIETGRQLLSSPE